MNSKKKIRHSQISDQLKTNFWSKRYVNNRNKNNHFNSIIFADIKVVQQASESIVEPKFKRCEDETLKSHQEDKLKHKLPMKKQTSRKERRLDKLKWFANKLEVNHSKRSYSQNSSVVSNGQHNETINDIVTSFKQNKTKRIVLESPKINSKEIMKINPSKIIRHSSVHNNQCQMQRTNDKELELPPEDNYVKIVNFTERLKDNIDNHCQAVKFQDMKKPFQVTYPACKPINICKIKLLSQVSIGNDPNRDLRNLSIIHKLKNSEITNKVIIQPINNRAPIEKPRLLLNPKNDAKLKGFIEKGIKQCHEIKDNEVVEEEKLKPLYEEEEKIMMSYKQSGKLSKERPIVKLNNFTKDSRVTASIKGDHVVTRVVRTKDKYHEKNGIVRKRLRQSKQSNEQIDKDCKIEPLNSKGSIPHNIYRGKPKINYEGYAKLFKNDNKNQFKQYEKNQKQIGNQLFMNPKLETDFFKDPFKFTLNDIKYIETSISP